MNVYEAVRTVLAVRSYQDKPIPTEAIHRLELGWLSWTGRHQTPASDPG